MGYRLKRGVSAGDVAEFLEVETGAPEMILDKVCSLSETEDGCLSYSVNEIHQSGCECLVIAPAGSTVSNLVSSDNPRLDFVKVLGWLHEQGYMAEEQSGTVEESAVIHPQAVIEPGASIGAGSIIGPFSHIHSCVSIGSNVQIGSSVTIGHPGFGFERDENGVPLHFHHFGRVVVDDEVVIGNNCTIARGSLSDTRIGRHVKMDDQAYIAHNVEVGDRTMIMSGVRCNGSVTVGAECWLGTAAIIREGITVGDNATVGMGSVVIRDIGSGETVYGNPARSGVS